MTHTIEQLEAMLAGVGDTAWVDGVLGTSEDDTEIGYIRTSGQNVFEVMTGNPDIALVAHSNARPLLRAAPDLARELIEAKRALEDAYDSMSALSSMLGAGMGDENTSISALVKRVEWGVNYFTECTGKLVDGIRAERDEAKRALADMREELEGWVAIAENCDITAGYCCCGDDMRTHPEPMSCGHSPVDQGSYTASGRLASTRAALGQKP